MLGTTILSPPPHIGKHVLHKHGVIRLFDQLGKVQVVLVEPPAGAVAIRVGAWEEDWLVVPFL